MGGTSNRERSSLLAIRGNSLSYVIAGTYGAVLEEAPGRYRRVWTFDGTVRSENKVAFRIGLE